jgi:hypothetical protein
MTAAQRLELATCLHDLRLIAHVCQQNADYQDTVGDSTASLVWRNTAFHITALLNRVDAAVAPPATPSHPVPTSP